MTLMQSAALMPRYQRCSTCGYRHFSAATSAHLWMLMKNEAQGKHWGGNHANFS